MNLDVVYYAILGNELGEHCQGCLQITKPFWADTCPVKSCCENKNLAHCGLCSDFPCDLAHQFAYDKEQGDNGKRLEQCKQWQCEVK